jgi:predicted metalloprotease with PDZ domain
MSATSTPALSYQVRVLPAEHELEVEMTLEGPAAKGTVHLELPTWVPGDYAFMQFARDLFDLRAEDVKTGAQLEVVREGWQGFRVRDGQGAVRVRYRAYAYEPDFSEPCGIVEDGYAVLLGARYLRAPAWTGPCRVTYHLPRGWKIHHPSGATQPDPKGKPGTWDYPSYEILLDSPVVVGHFGVHWKKVRGTPFYFVFVDRALGYDSEVQSFVDGMVVIAEKCHEIFGSFPFQDYTFVLSLSPGAEWGLEHLTSTMCGLGPDLFIDPGRKAYGTRVCAHELFHAWNVRRLRPAPLGQLDLSGGSFTEGLWVAEGFTRYYEFLLCTRAGVYSPEQFFSSVVNYYRHLSVVPAYERVSAVDSSLATYLNHSKYPGRCNNSIDYYDKGMLIAFDLDAELRLHNPADSLDDAFRAFYEQYAGNKRGYTTANVLRFFEGRQAGLGAMLSREAEQPGGLSVVDHLKRLGFRVEMESVHYLGLLFNDPDGAVVYNVLDDSPAGRSGIAPGDTLTRINEFPYSRKALAWVVGRPDPVTLEVTRGQRALTFKITPAVSKQISSLRWTGTNTQAQLIRTWLQRDDFRPAPDKRFSLEFYENFHGVETVL